MRAQPFTSPEEALKHVGVKGMRWGVRKKYEGYQNKFHEASPGAIKTSVKTKTGEVISVEKEKPNPVYLAIAKLTKSKPEKSLAAMVIHDSAGKKVGSFQIWRESPTVVRGEWLQIKSTAQGRGYSKAAIEGLIISAKKDPNLQEVRLQVPSNAAAAKHIYSDIGFKKDVDLGVVPGYGNLEDWVYRVE
jgi:ribosomal protein S18 acetylase RimI-like enzyme